MDQNVTNNVSDFPAKRPLRAIPLSLLITFLVGCLYYYLELPALNFKSGELYSFALVLLVVYCLCVLLFSGRTAIAYPKGYGAFLKRNCKIPVIAAILIAAACIIGGISSAVFFHADAYASLLEPVPGDFTAEINQISFNDIPMLDSDSAQRLGDRKLGELSDLVSQFEVSSTYSQINYQNRPVRVTYLYYADLFKWWSNRGEGLPGYITIDMVTQEAKMVRLSEGMKYSPGEHFGRNLYRHLRFSYPTTMFSGIDFEIDEDGHPYWICSVLSRTIGLFGGDDITGAVLMDAITGECTYYDLADIPTWVDRVFNAQLIINQYNYHGMYQNGFFNSLFGQKNCTSTTDGYNYIALNDDVWLYTGVTSLTSDESNIGFILVNQRTKESRYYAVAGATEWSARISAEGVVQHLNYVSTFPLLLNIADEPTYFMALKDDAGLVKMYAMVNVRQYQIVSTGTTVAECERGYVDILRRNGVIAEDVAQPETQQTITGKISEIRSAVRGGTTYYYLCIDGTYYRVSAEDCEPVVLLNVGDSVSVSYALDAQPVDGMVVAASVTKN